MEQRGFVTLGSRTATPSIEPGVYLEFFDPAPLSDWSACLQGSDDLSLGLSESQADLLCRLVYGSIIRDRSSGKSNPARLVNAALSGLPDKFGISEFQGMAKLFLSSRESILRDSIVYSSYLSDPTKCLFAQEDRVEPLSLALLEELTAQKKEKCGMQLLCCILLQVLMIHPLFDGNGRVARHLTVAASSDSNLKATAALIVGIQFWNRSWFNSLASKARSAGLHHYLDGYSEAFDIALTQLRSSNVVRNLIDASDPDDARQMLEEKLLMNRLFAQEILRTGEIRQQLSCSMSKATSIGDRILNRYAFIERDKFGLSIRKAAREVSSAMVI